MVRDSERRKVRRRNEGEEVREMEGNGREREGGRGGECVAFLFCYFIHHF